MDEKPIPVDETKRKLINIIILAMETIARDVDDLEKMYRYDDLEAWVIDFVESLCWDLKQ